MNEKVALVTGASRGIGAACARALFASGVRVAIHYRSDEAQARTLSESLPGSLAFRADLTGEQECKALIKSVQEQAGGLDILVNNAGISVDQLLPFAKPQDLDRVFDTNFKAMFHLTKAAARLMMKKRWGRIINVTSVVGHAGNPGQGLYAASKGATTAFTKSVACDLAGFGILVNCVAPGFIDTAMTASLSSEVRDLVLGRVPLARLGRPEEVAAAVLFLASDGASYITGSTLHVNGGLFMG